jgi:transcriptional regulator with XRE-family HTH domain
VPSARDPESIYRVFGRRLREVRERQHMPQQELATLSGLTRSSIANVENGKQRVLLHHLIKFAEALHVNVAALIPESGTGSLKMVDAEAQQEKNAYLEKLRSLSSTRSEK